MNRPDNIEIYDELDLKLGIKSSLPHVKSTIALAILLWECASHPAELIYSKQNNNEIVLTDEVSQWLIDYLEEICNEEKIDEETLISGLNQNQLLKSQMEALIVAFELIWRIAKVDFVEEDKAASAERTGGIRYPKKLTFTVNIDVIHSTVASNENVFLRILMAWTGFQIDTDPDYEKILISLLSALSEGAVFKLSDGNNDVIFNQNSIYKKILETNETVDVNGDKEAKGSLRILKSLLSDDMNPYLQYSSGTVSMASPNAERLQDYQKRVDTMLRLSATKIVVEDDVIDDSSSNENEVNETMNLDNKEFIFTCLDIMKKHHLLLGDNLDLLENKDKCAIIFKHNNFYGIIFPVDETQNEDEQRKDSTGNTKYYADKYEINGRQYFVSSEWRPDREDARRPLLDWIITQLKKVKYDTGYESHFARNRILFGAPGTGKSYTLNNDKEKLLESGGEYERVTFHPDYSYANFVGTYKPVPCNDDDGKDAITYEYVPGPFMRTYVKALRNSRTEDIKPYLLLIEEINRANVAAVFGDVFQLLDRDNNVSEYPIRPSEDIKKYLAKSENLGGKPEDYDEIKIPDNMFIWATMNSADQGVFPMDTAFKRRWDFKYLGIDDNDESIEGKMVIIGTVVSQKVEWNKLRKAINKFLANQKINEDKQLGPYFIAKRIVVPASGIEIDSEEFIETFKNKVIMYLFEDAAKQKRASLFEGCFQNSSRYSEICKDFEEKGIGIFNLEIQMAAEPEDIQNQNAISESVAEENNE